MNRTLIFDWDGTLHDTAHLYGCAFRSAYAWLVSEGYARPRAYSDAEVSVYLGMTARDMWDSFMPQLPREIKEQASAIIGREMIWAIRAGRAALYPGTEAVLDELKSLGFQMVILSNCKHEYMEAHREKFRLDRWFSGFYCSGDFAFAPKEEIVPVIQRRFPGRFAVIGDRDSDFRAAK
ncbi:MAG: HAD family hydrolase, partial [Oscillospiraceae bacterium]